MGGVPVGVLVGGASEDLETLVAAFSGHVVGPGFDALNGFYGTEVHFVGAVSDAVSEDGAEVFGQLAIGQNGQFLIPG